MLIIANNIIIGVRDLPLWEMLSLGAWSILFQEQLLLKKHSRQKDMLWSQGIKVRAQVDWPEVLHEGAL